jgi:hypothetical protein
VIVRFAGCLGKLLVAVLQYFQKFSEFLRLRIQVACE